LLWLTAGISTAQEVVEDRGIAALGKKKKKKRETPPEK
jgi:hypothetical protein